MNISNTKIPKRAFVCLLLFIAIALALAGRLFYLQIVNYEKYLSKVLDNITQENKITAERGTIYDRNMLQLATNSTTYRIFISPASIKDDDQAVLISTKLSELLGVDYNTIYEKTQKKNRKDETIKKNVEKEVADKVREFISANDLNSNIYLEKTNTRYYPYGTLASQVIGVMGTDGGLIGLELYYNSYLKGTDGVYKTTINAMGESMPTKYETYIEAEDGYNLVTTLDMNIQYMLENALKETYIENSATNGACGIVMDVNTGEVLGMAVYPSFDLNKPYVLSEDYQKKLSDSGYTEGSEDFNKLYWELVYSMWYNKAISDTYEPGSTFKIITSAAGLEEGVITENSVFTCTGSLAVGGFNIHCAKTTGHGTHDFVYMLQQSCNPTLMQVALRLGPSAFWKYFVDFGFLDKTGIDLPGESYGINHNGDTLTNVELATSAFGQTFKTTVIQELTAIATVANGGNLITPHLVSAMTDKDGNNVVSIGTNVKRQVVSEKVSKSISQILADGVTNNGAARNAYVAGYKIAAKTGTSEKRDKADANGEFNLRVSSCVGYAPADDPQIAVIIMVDEPQGTSRYGGTVAAPYIARIMSEVLPYLGIERKYTEDELKTLALTVADYSTMEVAKAKNAISQLGIKCEVVGDGPTIISQIPAVGEIVSSSNAKIILYTGNAAPTEYQEVPTVVGNTVSAAISKLIGAGFNVNITGAVNYDAGSGAQVNSQTPEGGSKALVGSVVTINCIHSDVKD